MTVQKVPLRDPDPHFKMMKLKLKATSDRGGIRSRAFSEFRRSFSRIPIIENSVWKICSIVFIRLGASSYVLINLLDKN